MTKTSLVLALCVATSVLGTARAEHTKTHVSGQTVRVSKFLGATVRDQSGQNIGEVKDIVLQPMNGQAEFAIISLNDSSHRDKLTAIPWRLIQPGTDPMQVTVNTDREKLFAATTFDNSSWPTFDSTYNQRIYTYYGVPYDRSAVGGRVYIGEGEYRAPVTTKENEKFPRPQPDGRETFPELNEREKSGNK